MKTYSSIVLVLVVAALSVVRLAPAESDGVSSPTRVRKLRRTPPPPLMPPKVALLEEEVRSPDATTSSKMRTVYGPVYRPYNSSPGIDMGVELGTVTRWTNLTPDFINNQFLLGGRFFGRWSPYHDIWLQPSLGLFIRGSGQGSVGVTQWLGEVGLNSQYAFYSSHEVQWLVGVAQRFDLTWSKISIYGTSDSTPIGLRYRLGPSFGAAFKLDSEITFIVDTEGTFTFTSPVHPYMGLTFGLAVHAF